MTNFFEERKHGASSDDPRSPYERDYGRVVHSAAFRRLQSKTQVLGLGDSDFYRTRLTHSMEVSQIGESISKLLYATAKNDEQTEVAELLSEDVLIRTICLAHDLGHPPFGHGGEVALNRCMLDFGGFEGNGQTLRIMAQLEPYTKEYGMDLTRRTLLGVLKYPAPYSEVVSDKAYLGKPDGGVCDINSIFVSTDFKPPKCYLDGEKVVVDWLLSGEFSDDKNEFISGRKTTGSKKHQRTKYKSLDTSIMELADDISYGVHDLEDAIGLHLITRRQFVDELNEEVFQPLLDDLGEGYSYDKIVDSLFSGETYRRKQMIGKFVNLCVCAISVKHNNKSLNHPLLKYQAVMDGKIKRTFLDSLQRFVVRNVIKKTNIQQLEFKGQKIITELFSAFATDPQRLLMPREWTKIENHSDDEKYKMRVICDYIAGMTDEYATKRYQQLFSPRVGSIFDQL